MIDRWSKELAKSGNSNLQLQQLSQEPVLPSGAFETKNQVLVQLVLAILGAGQMVLSVLPRVICPNVILKIVKRGETTRTLVYTVLVKVGL